MKLDAHYRPHMRSARICARARFLQRSFGPLEARAYTLRARLQLRALSLGKHREALWVGAPYTLAKGRRLASPAHFSHKSAAERSCRDSLFTK